MPCIQGLTVSRSTLMKWVLYSYSCVLESNCAKYEYTIKVLIVSDSKPPTGCSTYNLHLQRSYKSWLPLNYHHCTLCYETRPLNNFLFKLNKIFVALPVPKEMLCVYIRQQKLVLPYVSHIFSQKQRVCEIMIGANFNQWFRWMDQATCFDYLPRL